MTLKAEKFEKQIKRIHDALVQDHAEVKWNDKIPDPDNPKQLRQIDITVKKNGEIIHDPHPEGGGIETPKEFTFLVQLEPKYLIQ